MFVWRREEREFSTELLLFDSTAFALELSPIPVSLTNCETRTLSLKAHRLIVASLFLPRTRRLRLRRLHVLQLRGSHGAESPKGLEQETSPFLCALVSLFQTTTRQQSNFLSPQTEGEN